MTETPFSENRFENVRKNLYFLSASMLQRLEAPRSSFIIGARGTGKTTLLQALNWHERAFNKNLGDVLPPERFKTTHGHVFGIYQKLSESGLASVDAWARQVDEPTGDQYRGRYLESLWVEGVFRAAAEALADNIVGIAPEQEHAVTERIVEDWGGAYLVLRRLRPRTFAELARALTYARQACETAAIKGLSPDETHEILGDPTHPGEFLRDAVSGLVQLIEGAAPQAKSGWYVKICLDEAETLSPEFRTIVNGIIRVAKWPLFFTVSYAQLPEELLETNIPGLAILPTVDVDLIRLDRPDSLDDELGISFEAYVEGVSNARLNYLLGGEAIERHFSVNDFLGRINVNEILLRKLGGKSVSKEGRALLARAKEMEGHPFFRAYKSKDAVHGEAAPPPIYQTYLIETLDIPLPTEESPAWERRGQESAEIRSRMVAAYMAICDIVGADLEYSSSDVLYSLCDGCIRDFLNFLDAIYVEAACDLHNVYSKRIAPSVQSKAITTVSERKATGIRDRPVRHVREVEHLVRGLGTLTAALQRRAPELRHLRSPERGNVRLSLRGREAAYLERGKRIIRQAAEWGYLTILDNEEEELRIRVHTSLAPAYGFSYRGAYHDAPVHWSEVLALIGADSPARVEELVREWGSRGENFQESLSLFDS